MSIEARVNKLGLNGLIEDGIHVHSKELIIASQVNVHRFGLAKVLVRINGDSFKRTCAENDGSQFKRCHQSLQRSFGRLSDYRRPGSYSN